MIPVVIFIAAIMQLVTAAEKFSCEGRASGYYADVDTGCQVYHMCDGLGRQFSYSCPNTTLFQQRMLICDHWYMVNCSKSELDYSANLLIGQRDKPFVEDSSEHPYHRTPRPDLQQQPFVPRYQDDEYRQGRAQSASSNFNLVGIATDDENEDNSKKSYSTDRPQYFVPSHWSTQYGKGLTTPIPVKTLKSSKSNLGTVGKTSEDRFRLSTNVNYDLKYYKTEKTSPATVSVSSTTQFPRSSINPLKNINIEESKSERIPDSVTVASVSPSALALPPFVPKLEDRNTAAKEAPAIKVNQSSNKDTPFVPPPSIYYEPPKLSSSFDVESTTMDPETFYKLLPSKVLLPPVEQSKKNSEAPLVISPTTVSPVISTQKALNRKDTDFIKSSDSEKRWKELRQMFFIPEYDFPLEVGSRPSYESGLSSFQVNPIPQNSESKSTLTLTPNPDCPKCDPAFLTPGTCKPCVMIRR